MTDRASSPAPANTPITTSSSMASSILGPFLVSRLLFLAATLAVATTFRERFLINLWDRWDSEWYGLVAQHGYFVTPGSIRSDLAFYPLLPMLMHAVHLLTGLNDIVAGLLIANVAFGIALVYLRRLAEMESVPPRVLWLVAMSPTAFFFAAAYAESLFLLAAAGGLYYARRGAWEATDGETRTGPNSFDVRAGFFAAFGVLAHPTGMLIAIPVAYASWRSRGKLAACVAVLPALIVQLGTWLYLTSVGGPAAVFGVQRAWHRELAWPWMGFVASAQRLFDQKPLFAAEDTLQLATTILILAITVVAWRKLTAVYRVYLGAFWLLVLCTPAIRDHFYAPFLSMDRFVLGLFPLAFWASSTLNSRRFYALIAASSLILIGSTTAFLMGGWVG